MYAEVILGQGSNKKLTYSVPDNIEVKIGQAVVLPLRQKSVIGYIYRLYSDLPSTSFKLKNITRVHESNPFFNEKDVELISWLADYYITPESNVLSAVLPVGSKKTANVRLSIDKQLVRDDKDNNQPLYKLSDEQTTVFNKIVNSKNNHHLLFGITGSGKTEVYLHLIEHYFRQGKSAVLLVPEIALTYQIQRRLVAVFGDKVSMLHSLLSAKERKEQWLKIYHSEQCVVFGTRSAVFAPVKNLGIIIIDEEQDTSYKQESFFRYNARVAAYKKAQLHNARIIYGTATPLITSYYQAQKNIELTTLNNRFNQQSLPEVKIINMQKNEQYPRKILSNQLIMEIKKNLDVAEQVILLYNQRGVSRFVMCLACGEPIMCKRCSVTMTLHEDDKMKCHYCGVTQAKPEVCPTCGSPKIGKVGKGIQSIFNELSKTFPFAKISRLDSDLTDKAGYLEETLKQFADNKIDILIGTQIVAKGHHFPQVTLVGVIDADMVLFYPDIYATERTYDLLVQVFGRAGRQERKGRVLVQTSNPSHYAIKAAIENNYEMFYKKELAIRKSCTNPPFSRIIRVILEHQKPEIVEEEIKVLYSNTINRYKSIEILPPFPAPIDKIKNKYRWHFIIKYPNDYNSQELKAILLEELTNNKYKSKIKYDVDPVNFT